MACNNLSADPWCYSVGRISVDAHLSRGLSDLTQGPCNQAFGLYAQGLDLLGPQVYLVRVFVLPLVRMTMIVMTIGRDAFISMIIVLGLTLGRMIMIVVTIGFGALIGMVIVLGMALGSMIMSIIPMRLLPIATMVVRVFGTFSRRYCWL
jgi:hypothetical protein